MLRPLTVPKGSCVSLCNPQRAAMEEGCCNRADCAITGSGGDMIWQTAPHGWGNNQNMWQSSLIIVDSVKKKKKTITVLGKAWQTLLAVLEEVSYFISCSWQRPTGQEAKYNNSERCCDKADRGGGGLASPIQPPAKCKTCSQSSSVPELCGYTRITTLCWSVKPVYLFFPLI